MATDPNPLTRAGILVSRLIKEHIRESFRIDPALLKQLDKLVAVTENPSSLMYMVYEIDPVDQPHEYVEYVSLARPDDAPSCRICGRRTKGHESRQAEVRALLGI